MKFFSADRHNGGALLDLGTDLMMQRTYKCRQKISLLALYAIDALLIPRHSLNWRDLTHPAEEMMQ